MSSSTILLPPVVPLSTFAEKGLRAIYTAPTQLAFDNAFSNFFYRNLDVTLNGQKVTSEQFKQELWNEKHHERRGTVNYLGVVDVANDTNLLNVSIIS